MTLITNNISSCRLSFVLRPLVDLSRTIATIIVDRARNPWGWHHLLLLAKIRIVILSFVYHEGRIFVLIRTQTDVESFFNIGEFCERSTVRFIFFTRYLSILLEWSSFVVDFFGVVCKNRLNRLLRSEYKRGNLILQQKSFTLSVSYFMHPWAKRKLGDAR